MQTPQLDFLSQQIENLVRQHLDEYRSTIRAAVDRALAIPTVGAAGAVQTPEARRRAPREAGAKPRRTQMEIEQVAERASAVVADKPGATMMMIALELGAKTCELQRPMALLKRQGRVRSAGLRSLTRYYPTTVEEKAA